LTQSTNNKKELRNHFRALRRELPTTAKQQAAMKIAQRLIKLSEYQQAQHIGVYSALSEEASLNSFSELAWKDDKSLYLPVINKQSKTNQITFQMWTSKAALAKNSIGIFEPEHSKLDTSQSVISPQLDLLLLPLVAYDNKGTRLGMGGGFYDRYLEKNLSEKCLLIGVAFACQEAQILPKENWDIPLHAIINENNFIRF